MKQKSGLVFVIETSEEDKKKKNSNDYRERKQFFLSMFSVMTWILQSFGREEGKREQNHPISYCSAQDQEGKKSYLIEKKNDVNFFFCFAHGVEFLAVIHSSHLWLLLVYIRSVDLSFSSTASGEASE